METVAYFTTALVLLAQVSFLTAVDFQSVKEPCFEITKTVPLDMNWVSSVKTWYYPLMSRLDLLWSATYVAGKDQKDLSEDQLYYDSCISVNFDHNSINVVGFGGLREKIDVQSLKGFESFTQSSEGKMMTTSWATLTDNSTFVFFTTCSPEDGMSWGAISPNKELSKEATKSTHDHAEALGFKKEFFTALRFNSINLHYQDMTHADGVTRVLPYAMEGV